MTTDTNPPLEFEDRLRVSERDLERYFPGYLIDIAFRYHEAGGQPKERGEALLLATARAGVLAAEDGTPDPNVPAIPSDAPLWRAKKRKDGRVNSLLVARDYCDRLHRWVDQCKAPSLDQAARLALCSHLADYFGGRTARASGSKEGGEKLSSWLLPHFVVEMIPGAEAGHLLGANIICLPEERPRTARR